MNIDIPKEWRHSGLDELNGLVMVVGAPNTGKSTLCAYLYDLLSQGQHPAAFLDGDPGQSRLGPPTTITLALNKPGEAGYPPLGKRLRKFVGSTSPVGHMLPLLAGAGRLVERARQMGCSHVVYDTTGLVDPSQGGLALKCAKIDLLDPPTVIAIQNNSELDPLLRLLRRSGRVRVVQMAPSPAVIARDTAKRQRYRAERFASYFSPARKVILDWREYGIFPEPRFALNRLVSLEDGEWFTLGLGIILDLDRAARQVQVLTPVQDISQVRNIYLGGVLVDPLTFQDQRTGK
ncbi:MAG: Clp1/GlmU family protein [Anaerolineales bacterium]